jgi:hypothetical protein
MSSEFSIKNDIKHCRKIIEDQLSWKNNTKWTRRDYELLIEKIFESTGVLLSLSTVRRIWNNDFKNLPHKSTLDALAVFAGFSDWQDFKENHTPAKKSHSKKSIIIGGGLILIIVVITVFLLLILNLKNSFKVQITGPVKFSYIQKSDSTVPCIVVFDYDVRNIVADSFFIIESAHDYEKKYLPVANGQLTSSYYHPGTYHAFLVANDSIVKKLGIEIVSNNWVGMISYQNSSNVLPYYFYYNKIIENGSLSVSPKLLHDNNIPLKDDMFMILSKTYNIDIKNCNYTLKTRVKLDSFDINSPSPEIYIGILFKNDFCYMPLVQNGGQDKLQVKHGNIVRTSNESDLSGFGCNLYSWQDVEITCNNHLVTFYVNNTEVLQLIDSTNLGALKGTSINFDGVGSLDYLLIKDADGDTTYFDSF